MAKTESHPPDEQSPSETPGRKPRRKQDRYEGVRRAALRLTVTTVFLASVYFSAKLGVSVAKKRLPSPSESKTESTSDGPFVLGETGEPIYLAETTDSLRRFFSSHPTETERARANLSGTGIRRLAGAVEMTTLRAEADAVQVKIASGAMDGAVLWLHHSQLPGPSAFDPIISPVPAD